MRRTSFLFLLIAWAAWGQKPETVTVVSRTVERSARLPGEILPYQTVELRARVSGFIERVEVDRGSVVKKGQLLALLSAPEMKAHIAESESKVQTAESQRVEAEARLVAAQATYQHLKTAAETPGVVAGNDLELAAKAVDAARAQTKTAESSIQSARAAAAALRDLEAYLQVTAPFDGVVTERFLHPGALVGPQTGPVLRLEQNSRLRLVVAVPESDVAGIVRSARVTFSVPAYKGESFAGTVARISHTLDPKTRTMAVELDVENSQARLAPGMYPEVGWPVRKPRPSLLVPPSSVATNTERTFVIRVANGKAEWVNVSKGTAAGDLLEVFGPLSAGDVILKRASDEIREGTALNALPPK